MFSRLAHPTVSRFLLRRMATEGSPLANPQEALQSGEQVTPQVLAKVLKESLASVGIVVAEAVKQSDGHNKVIHALILAVGASVTAIATSLWNNVSLVLGLDVYHAEQCERPREEGR